MRTGDLEELMEKPAQVHVPADQPLGVLWVAPGWTAETYHACANRRLLAKYLEEELDSLERFTDNLEAFVFARDAVITDDHGILIGMDGYPLARIQSNTDSDFGWTIEGV